MYSIILLSFVVLSCGLFGRISLIKLGFNFRNYTLRQIIYISFGLGILTYLLIFLSFIGLLYNNFIVLILFSFLFLGLARLPLKMVYSDIKSYFNYEIFRYHLSIKLIIITISILYLLVQLSPTLDGDSLAGYLILAKEYFKFHGIVEVDFAYGNYLPQNGILITALGFLIKNQILAQILISWLMGLICIFSIYSIGKFLFNEKAAIIGVLIWYSTSTVSFLSQSVKIDLAWSAYELMAIFIFIHWYYSNSLEKNNNLLLSGFFLGLAGGIKQASIFTILILSIAIIIRFNSNNKKHLMEYLKIYSLFILPVSISGIWLIRNYFLYNEIIYLGEVRLPNTLGISGLFKTIWQMSMLGNAFGVEGAMGKPIGPIFLALAPAMFYFRNKKNVKEILIFCIAIILLWYFFGVQRARHLLPTLALLSLLAGNAVRLFIKSKPRIGYPILFIIVLTTGLNMVPWFYTNFISLNRHGYILGQYDLNEYLKHNLKKSKWYPNYAMTIKIRDELSNDIKIVALSSGNSYYIGKPFYSPGYTWTAKNNFFYEDDELKYSNHEKLYKKLKKYDITHVFINDYVVAKWNLKDTWLNQTKFQNNYLIKEFEHSGQHLFSLK